MRKINQKRTQQEIIVTVLLVLIALAAVALIATFVINQIKDRTSKANAQLICSGVQFEVTKAVAAVAGSAEIIVKRNDNENLTGAVLKVTVDGETWNNSAPIPASLETVKVTSVAKALVAGKSIELGVTSATGISCPIANKFTVTAA